ncbi:MAG: MBL fold metallo-hydrolase [Planctomycetota bacterium]
MAGTLRFYGAVRNVTGTKHLLEWEGERLLFDCGLVQGRREESYKANLGFPIDTSRLDHVVLSHAHIDHSGTLPVLVRRGYRGRIWSTPGTRDLCELLLEDSAQIQMSDTDWLNRKKRAGQRAFSPLYEPDDVPRTMKLFKTVPYRERVDLSDRISLEFLDAGHILGSAMVVLDLRSPHGDRRLAFTGDHGRPGQLILRDPAHLPEVDVLMTESTYGGRRHPDRSGLDDLFVRLVHEAVERGGRLLIPAFAVGRTQAIVYRLHELRDAGRIPDIRIFVDSPLATKATKVVADHPECFDGATRKLIEQGKNPFFYEGLRYVRDVEESKGLNQLEGPLVILAASGMCESGRIVHHLKVSLGREEDTVLIAGFQARHTLGRKLVDGNDRVRIHGREFTVRARIEKAYGASAHGDEDEIAANLRHLAPTTRRTFVVHGEEESSFAFRDRLLSEGFGDVVVPEEGAAYELP